MLTPEVAAADVVAGVVAGMPAGMFAGISAGVWADAFGAVLDVGRVVLPVALPGCKSSANCMNAACNSAAALPAPTCEI